MIKRPVWLLGLAGIVLVVLIAVQAFTHAAKSPTQPTASPSVSSTPTPGSQQVGVGATLSYSLGGPSGPESLKMTFKSFQRMAATPAGQGYAAAEFSINYQAGASRTSTFDIVDDANISDYNDNMYNVAKGVNSSTGPLLPSGPLSISGGKTVTGWIVFRVPPQLPVNLKFVTLYPGGTQNGGFQWLLSGPLQS
jgi:hypothetical protein